MKKTFTLLFVLYFCTRLSASVIRPHIAEFPLSPFPDTTSAKQKQDSTKLSATVNYGVKLTTGLIIKDNTILLASVNDRQSFKLSITEVQPYSVDLGKSDHSPKSAASTIESTSPNPSGSINITNNLKLLTSGLQLDSLRAA